MTAGVQSFLDAAATLLAGVARASWQACALALVVLLLHRLFGDRIPARVRYNLWLLVVLRLALPVTPQSSFSLFNLFRGLAPDLAAWQSPPQITPRQASEPAPLLAGVAPHALTAELPAQPLADPGASAGTAPDAAAPPIAVAELDRVPRADRPSVPVPEVEHWSRRAGTSGTLGQEHERPSPAVVTPAHHPEPAVAAPSPATPLAPRLYRTAAAVWLAGVLLLLGRVLLASLRLSRSLRRMRVVRDPVVAAVAHECAAQLGLRQPPAIFAGADVSSPALVGFLHPRLLLPPRVLETLSRRELRLVLLHEMSHLCRRDVLMNWVLTALQVLHWFNPLVRLIAKRVRADRELACDEAVLAVAGRQDRSAYGRTILRVLDALGRGAANTTPTLAAGRVGIVEFCESGGAGKWGGLRWPGANGTRNLTRRITMIARFDEKRRGWTMLAALCSLALGGAALTDAVAADPPAKDTAAVTPAAGDDAPSAAPSESARDEGEPGKASNGSAREESGATDEPAPAKVKPKKDTAKKDTPAKKAEPLQVNDTLLLSVKEPDGKGSVQFINIPGCGQITLPGLNAKLQAAGETEEQLRTAVIAAYKEEKNLPPDAIDVSFDRKSRRGVTSAAPVPVCALAVAPASAASNGAPVALPPGHPTAVMPPPVGLAAGGPVAPMPVPPPPSVGLPPATPPPSPVSPVPGGPFPPVPAPTAQPPATPGTAAGAPMSPGGPSPYPMPGAFPGAAPAPGGNPFAQPGMAPGYGPAPAPQEGPQPYLAPGMPGAPGGGMMSGPGRSRADAERDALLGRKLPEVKFDQIAVSDVIDHLRDVSGSNLVVDWRALESAGVKQNSNITLQLRNVSFRKALETALFLASGDKDLLDYQADDGVILVSTAAKLQRARQEGVKSVAPLPAAAPRLAPAAQPAPMTGGIAPRAGGEFNPFSQPNATNRRAGAQPGAPATEPPSRGAAPKEGSGYAPAERRRGTGNRGTSSGSGRAPAAGSDGDTTTPGQPSTVRP